jgi:hypothetical protein
MDTDVGIVAALFGLTFFLGLAAVAAVVWWRILSKTGHSGWLGLLMLVPIANVILILVLAFGEWPIHRELRDLKLRSEHS